VNDSAGNQRHWWSEIKRRGILHVTGLYLIAAWAVLQLAEHLAQVLEFPSQVLRLIWVALILIFPIALIFGWRYDIKRDGLVHTDPRPEGGEDLPLVPLDHCIIGGLSLVVAAIVGFTALEIVKVVDRRVPVEPPDPPANSIAVLPFSVCSGGENDKILAEGLASEVINRLATLGTLKVIARTSSFTMAGLGLPTPQIALPLAVKYLLTGELCRDGGKLMLRIELLDEAGYLVWSDSFEEAVDTSDTIALGLAERVADGVGMALGYSVTSRAGTPVNRLAYEQLLIGRAYANREEFGKARSAFEKARRYEPENAEAIFALATLVEQEALSNGKLGLGSVRDARPAGEQALVLARGQLADGSADFRTHFVIGWILYELGKWDRQLTGREARALGEAELSSRLEAAADRFAEAETHLRLALSLNPSDIDTYELLAYSLERQGVDRRSEALEIFEEGLRLDPFNTQMNRNVAKRWAARGRYRPAMELLERFEALPRIPQDAWFVQMEIQKLQTYWDEKCELLIEMLRDDPSAIEHAGNYGHLTWFPSELAWLGLNEEAEAWYQRVEKIPADGWAAVLREWSLNEYAYAAGLADDDLDENLALIEGKTDEEILDEGLNATLWLAEVGEYERAIRLAELEQHSRFDSPFWAEREAGPRLWLAELYRKAGREDDADRLYESIVGGLEAKYDAGIRHPSTLDHLAEAYAGLGRDDEALDMLRKAVDYHLRWMVLDERWPFEDQAESPLNLLRDDPRYVAQVDRMEADLDQQARRIRNMLAQYDIDELLAPVMALAQERVADTQNR